MANQTGLGNSPGVNTALGGVAVTASQLTTQTNIFPGSVAPTYSMNTAVAALTSATPTTPGVLASASLNVPTFTSASPAFNPIALPTVTAQLTTQVNPGFPSEGINSVVQAEQQLAVAGQTYNSPGGILNRVGPGVVGGGP